MQKNKKLIIAGAAILIVVAIMTVIYITTRPGTNAGAKTITVEVVHSDKSEKTFTYQTDAEYLGEVLLAEGLIGGDGASDGLFTIVDGEQAIWEDNGAYWAFYEDGEYAQQGVNTTPIADGSAFSLVYTIG